jgi:xylan 1,4-beta-xylosidase
LFGFGRVVKRIYSTVVVLAVLVAGAALARAQDPYTPPPADPPPYTNPVVAGNFPDPTAVRIGPEYWAIATAPVGGRPPIMRSPDLVNWTLAGYLFADPPAWSTGRQLWGPSLERFGDNYVVYYSARKKYGHPCVTVADSPNPIGPYTDQGPLVCGPVASIDPSVIHNNHGRPYLVWKENGGDEPSSIWTQPLSFDGLQLVGTAHEIMVGRRDNWEGGLVEGPRIIRRDGWLYLFYSGGNCCAPTTCKYTLGVARARSIYGPWRRAKKPLLTSTKSWKCPGTGAVLQTPSGHWWLLYHGYRARGSTHRGREMLLDLVHWSRDGWPWIKPGSRPVTTANPPPSGPVTGGSPPPASS